MNKTFFSTIGLLFVLAVEPMSAIAQTVDDVGQWSAFFTQDRFSSDSPFKWWFDGHYRLFEDNDGFGQSIVRPGLGVDVGESSTLWAGYGWINTSPILGDDTNEHRLWQQWTWAKAVDPYRIAARTRYEQRLLESSDDVGLRLRQFVRGQKELGACSKYTFVVWDELFIALNDTDWGQRGGFDQNRIFVGFGMKRHHDSRWRVEVGYMNQTVNRLGPNDLSNHVLAVNVFRGPRF